MKNIIHIIIISCTLVFLQSYFSQGNTIDYNKLNKHIKKLLSEGKYKKAKSIIIQDFNVNKENITSNHPGFLQLQNNLAMIYCILDNNVKAKKLYKRILEVKEEFLGPEHLDIAPTLSNIAGIYCTQGHKTKAKLLFIRVLNIYKKNLAMNILM